MFLHPPCSTSSWMKYSAGLGRVSQVVVCRCSSTMKQKLVGSRRKFRDQLLIQELECADDMALVTDSVDGLQRFLQTLDACCTDMG